MERRLMITDTDSIVSPGEKEAVAYGASKALRFGKNSNHILPVVVKHTILLPVIGMVNIADAVVAKVAVPFPFTLNSVAWRQGDKAVTTGSKLSTATAQVAGVSVTGGVVALTSATCTPAGSTIAGSAVTAGNTGAAGDTVGVIYSATTAFIEGNGWFEFNVTELSE